MTPRDIRTLTTRAGAKLAFTALGFGGAPVGNMLRTLAEDEAEATVAAAWDAGLRYFDTAPLYGHGLSEARIGRVLGAKPRAELMISTKVGRLLSPCAPGEEDGGIFQAIPPLEVRFDYTRGGVLRCVEESLARLGLDRVDILYVHDLELGACGSRETLEARWRELTDGGGWRALAQLRASGVVRAIGLGVNETAACERLLSELDPDLFLLAGRYTLLEQAPLASLLPECERRGVGVVVGGPYNSGVLVRAGGGYDYAAPPPQVLERVERLAAVCARFDTPLAAAALQFPAFHPAVVSVIPGGQTPEEVAANARLFSLDAPAELWSALKDEGLLPADAPIPSAERAPC